MKFCITQLLFNCLATPPALWRLHLCFYLRFCVFLVLVLEDGCLNVKLYKTQKDQGYREQGKDKWEEYLRSP